MCEVVELGGLEWDKNSDLYQLIGTEIVIWHHLIRGWNNIERAG